MLSRPFSVHGYILVVAVTNTPSTHRWSIVLGAPVSSGGFAND
jgi:hypothetical protein